MKTIGLIGGMSWESSLRYYQLINTGISDKLGELHSANIVMSSMDFYELEKLQKAGRWIKAAEIIEIAAINLQFIDADCIVICSVTGHSMVERLEGHCPIPVLHIADCINDKIKGFGKVGLIGTKYTMEMDYFKGRLNAEVIVPDETDIQYVNHVIYNELCKSIVSHTSRIEFLKIMQKLDDQGVEAIILGCTEIGLFFSPDDFDGIPILDSTIIHAKTAVDFALGEVMP